MVYTLRKSYGPYSAGTPVNECPGGKCFDKDGLMIPVDMVVKRRNRSPIVNYNPKDMEKLYG